MLDAVLTSAFDATPEKLETAREPLKASLHAMALKAARQALLYFLCVPSSECSWSIADLARLGIMPAQTCKRCWWLGEGF